MALRVSPRSPFEEYHVGQVLDLKPDDAHCSYSSLSSPIFARIRELHSQTLSYTMVIDILHSDGSVNTSSSPAFLKLYDRRFAVQDREDNGIKPWTREVEQAYIDGLKAGTVSKFLHDLHTIEDFQHDTEDDWDDVQLEASLGDVQRRMYNTETKVYSILREYQGSLIPKLLAAVTLEHSLPATNGAGQENGNKEEMNRLYVKGILLQYIEGFDLGSMMDHAPRGSWQGLLDQAVAIVRTIGEHHLMNRDVRPANFIVTRTREDDYQVYMIDFALCEFKGEHESDAEWALAKWSRDEDGAIGLVMQKRVEKASGVKLRYEVSFRFLEEAKRGGLRQE